MKEVSVGLLEVLDVWNGVRLVSEEVGEVGSLFEEVD